MFDCSAKKLIPPLTLPESVHRERDVETCAGRRVTADKDPRELSPYEIPFTLTPTRPQGLVQPGTALLAFDRNMIMGK